MYKETVLKKEILVNKTLCRFFGIAIFVALTSLGAFVRIPLPFTPVPVTLQTFFVLLSGAFLGSGLGALAQASYLALGLTGLPIFTGTGSGLSYLGGPTTGYLIGFVLASFFLGKNIKRAQDNLILIFSLFCLADLLLLASGALWLGFLFGFHLPKLLAIGILPFLAADLLKAWASSVIYRKLKSRLEQVF